MHITQEQATIIAKALMRPINDGYAESEFGVYNGDQGVVGIRRSFKKAYIFVEFNGKGDKSVRLPKMSTPLQLEEVIDRVTAALDVAKTLEDKELDTEKPNFHPHKVGSFLKNRPEYTEAEKEAPVEEADEEPVEEAQELQEEVVNEELPVEAENTEAISEEEVAEEIPTEDEAPVTEDDNTEAETELSEEELPQEEAEAEEESEDAVPEDEDTQLQDETDNENNEKEVSEPVIVEKYEEVTDDMVNDVDIRTLETDDGEPNLYYPLSAVEDTEQNDIQAYDPAKASFLCKQIQKNSDESAEEMKKVFGRIIEHDPATAEKIFMVTMVTALKRAGGDTEKLAEDLGVDEKDIIMANYEYELRKIS